MRQPDREPCGCGVISGNLRCHVIHIRSNCQGRRTTRGNVFQTRQLALIRGPSAWMYLICHGHAIALARPDYWSDSYPDHGSAEFDKISRSSSGSFRA